MRTIDRIIVGAYIESADGYLLFGQKHAGQGGVYGDDCWHIPGGGVEEGESHKEAIVRELAEEVGLDVSHYNIELVDDEGKGASPKTLASGEEVMCNMCFHCYHIDVPMDHAEVSLPENTAEFAAIKWVHRDAVKDILLTPPGQELWNKITG